MNKATLNITAGQSLSRNAARMLAEIRRRGETSRVDIVEALELSPATVTTAAAALIDAGLVVETGAEPGQTTGRGRPKVALRLNPTARYFAGAKLNDGAITVGIMDFSGGLVSHETLTFPRGSTDTDTLVDRLDAVLNAALSSAEMSRSDLTAMGLGVPGYIETESGVCRWSPLLHGGPVDLKTPLEAKLSLPVHVDNDANLVTLAELWFGHGRREQSFLVVTIEHGVGLGVVIDGRLFRGGRGLGSEFGHMKVQNEGALCRCGQRGCVEAYVADYAIAREATAALSRFPDAGDTAPMLERLADLAQDGDAVAAAIFQRAGRMLGLGLANLANLFDPAMIVLAGTRMKHHHLMAEETERTLRANTLGTGRGGPDLKVHRWGDELWARGAGSLAIDRTFAADIGG